MSVKEDLRKLFGNTMNQYQHVPNRPRLLGGAGIAKLPYGGDMPASNICLDLYSMLHFNANGQPSINSARAIDGLFEVNTGRQVRIFTDDTAVICSNSNVSRYSDYTWYKLQLKNNHEAVLDRQGITTDCDFMARHWWFSLDLLSLPLVHPYTLCIMREYRNLATYKDSIYKILKTTPLNAKAFFTTIPLKDGLLTANKEAYKKAVEQIYNFTCGYINADSKYDRESWLELYAYYGNTNSMTLPESNLRKLQDLISVTEKYAGKTIPEGGERVYTWKTPQKPFIYGSAYYNYTLDAKSAYWGIAPKNFALYESRWKFADDLVYGVSLIKDYALKNAGISSDAQISKENASNVCFADHYIQGFDRSEGAKQYFNQDVSFYYRNRYDVDGNETGDEANEHFVTLSDKGITRLWSVDIMPDSAIIDVRFDSKSAKFIPAHPTSPELIPEELKQTESLSLKDENDNLYSITVTDGGYLLHSAAAGKTWKISNTDFMLSDLEEKDKQ